MPNTNTAARGQHHRRRHHEGQVELPGLLHHPSRQPGRRHARQVGDSVLQAGPFARGARPASVWVIANTFDAVEPNERQASISSAMAVVSSRITQTGRMMVESVRPSARERLAHARGRARRGRSNGPSTSPQTTLESEMARNASDPTTAILLFEKWRSFSR